MALTLVRELALSGITTMGQERIAQVRALAETLRAERLRRMSARLLELVGTLVQARVDSAGLDAVPSDLKRALSRALSKGKSAEAGHSS